MIEASPFGLARFVPLHDLYLAPGEDPSAHVRADLQVVTAACFVTPRELYLDLGGLDEGFWNGYEDVDYCLKVRARGLRVVYEPEAVLTHFESQSGTQRFRRVAANVERLARRWNGRVEYDEVARALRRGEVRRRLRASNGILTSELLPVPTTTVLVHGARDGFDAAA
jgi:GT2 family glycosyltransferase